MSNDPDRNLMERHGRILNQTIFAMAVLLGCNFCPAQVRQTPHQWRATIKVVDDEGHPVSGAESWVAYVAVSADGAQQSERISGMTDTNGSFIASHTDRSVYLGLFARKSGYYETWAQQYLGFAVDEDARDWNPRKTLVLKRKLNPIAMFAKKVETKLPRENEPVGFDLEAGDWVAPFGSGIKSDIFLTARRKITSPEEFNATLDLTFPNAGDGLVAVPPSSETENSEVAPN